MKITVDAYKTQQTKLLTLLDRLTEFLNKGEDAGFEIDLSLKEKLQSVIQSVSGSKLKVALIGGFSEGKTAIAAAWMERLDKSSMKISHQESSDEVKIYDLGSDTVLIDTPGLFGFKEKENEQTHKVEKYKEITEKYVSEAHLVLYVMDSANPIKDSHKEELNWLFRTLNLFPRTVFVLSRFDEVADVEDERDYRANLKIKRENVHGRLCELVQLSDKELANLSIVAVAANPWDMGMEHWLENLAQFKALSHIGELQEATSQKIKASGGHGALVAETCKSVISDVLDRQLPLVIDTDKRIAEEASKLIRTVSSLNKQMESTGNQIAAARSGLRDSVARYFTDLIMQAKGTSLETFIGFFEREVGSEGINITTKLQNLFDKHLQSARLEVSRMNTSFNGELDHFNTIVTALGKRGVSFLQSSGWINRNTVLATRDGLVSAGKVIGMDLGKWLKFKPWGATKLANGLSGGLAFLGIALEALDSYQEHQRQEAFKNAVTQLVSDFEQQRKNLLDLINGDQFEMQFFGDFIELKKGVQEVEDGLQQDRERQQRFHEWSKEARAIDVEFRELSAA